MGQTFENVKIYMAPLEGITGYIYRNAQAELFGGINQYYAPFIDARINRPLKSRELRDILPENNKGISLIPQIMTNHSDAFLKTAEQLQALNYNEINLNLGCPSPTVVRKGRGAGFLASPAELEKFFYEIYEDSHFSSGQMKLSIKTRLGIESPEEIHPLLQVYNQFPITELILHPRVQIDYYKNQPDLEAFRFAVHECKIPIVYNGDIISSKDCLNLHNICPEVSTIMIGRGILMDPSLPRRLNTNTSELYLTKTELRSFHDLIYSQYQEFLSGEVPVLHKMKELWFYWITQFSDYKKPLKALKKSQSLREYESNVSSLFEFC